MTNFTPYGRDAKVNELTEEDVKKLQRDESIGYVSPIPDPHYYEQSSGPRCVNEDPEHSCNKAAPAPQWWHYILVRKELKDGALLAQLTHAAGCSAAFLGTPVPEHTRACVLVVTKEQMGDVYGKLSIRSDEIGKTLYIMKETEGQLAGSYTAMGFLTSDKQSIIDVIGHLKPWKKAKAEVAVKDLIMK